MILHLCRTFSNYIFTGETRCAGCLCTNSGLGCSIGLNHPNQDQPQAWFPVLYYGLNRFDPMSKCREASNLNLAISAMMWFEKVRGGSMRLNHPDLVHKHPAHLVSPP